jgi:hypothetical protein
VPNYSVLKVGDGSVDAESFNALIDALNAAGGGGSVATDAIFDAAGDLPVGSGADTAQKLPIGTNTQVLTVDTAQALKMKWAAAAGGAPTYTAYTPTLSGSVSNPSLGGGSSIVARYSGVSGSLVHYYGKLSWGTSPTVGSGNYHLSLPRNALITGGLGNMFGMVMMFRNGTPTAQIANYFDFWDQATTRIQFLATWPSAASMSFVGAAAPWTWANGDSMWWHLFYEAA